MNPTQAHIAKTIGAAALFALLTALPATADPFFFSTGGVTNQIATASRPGSMSGTNQETESADDFLLNSDTRLNSATFTGLIPTGASVSQVIVEIYRVFPKDSDMTRIPNVPTRVNSPSDVEFLGRDSTMAGELSFTTTQLSASFTALASVDTNVKLNAGSAGAATGREVRFDVRFDTPIDLPADHYFFVPQVLLDDDDAHFLWLSATRPIDPAMGGTPFMPDLQSWMRNADLDPDWLRIGTDIIGGVMFNAAFTLTGEAAAEAPEPASLALLGAALGGMGAFGWRRQHRRQSLPPG